MSQTIAIIPKPQACTSGKGELQLNRDSNIICSGDGALELGHLLAEYLRPATGFAFPVTEESKAGTLRLEVAGSAKPDEAGFEDEHYTLVVNESNVYLRAQNATGLARGIQSLRQLFPAAIMADTI